jgi:hypothetical protein
MNSQYAQQKIDFLDFVFSDLDSKTIDPQIQSYLAQHLTVLICGIYEDIIENLLMEFVQRDPISVETGDFIYNAIDRSFRNPDQSNLKNILKQFCKTWPHQLDTQVSDNDWKAFDSIASQKNLIAHGGQSQITYKDIKKYYISSKNVIIQLDLILLQGNSTTSPSSPNPL